MKKEQIKLVIYLRVSTQEQGKSGLGLLAQEQDINNKIQQLRTKYKQVIILNTFKDIASGKSRNNRDGLKKALKLCYKEQAYLIFQKLDRLSRDIMDGISIYKELNQKMFIAQWEQIDPFLFNIRLCIAQQEREQISIRTKKALTQLKNKGIKLGRKWKLNKDGKIIKGQNQKAVKLMLKVRQNNSKKHYKNVNIMIKDYHNQGYSYSQIAKKLNELDHKTIYGKKIGVHTIQWLIKQYKLFSKTI